MKKNVLESLDKIYKSKFVGMFLHTFYYSIQKELKDCESVLDLGCGSTSPLQYCKNIKYSLGVEAFEPYLKKARQTKIHTEYLNRKIQYLELPEKSFDAVIMIEVLEHLKKEDGLKIIINAQKWARKKVLITSPNGFFQQSEMDGNYLQEHLSGWEYKKMKKMGFISHGSGGLKYFRTKLQTGHFEGKMEKTAEIFWKVLSVLSQSVTYFFPKSAFSLLSIKDIK